MELSYKVRQRQAIERRIVSAVIDAAIKARYNVTVDDGGATPIKMSVNKRDILKAMFSVDQEHLILKSGRQIIGWVFFVYGNDGWDVINDYSTNLEPLMEGRVNQLIERYQ